MTIGVLSDEINDDLNLSGGPVQLEAALRLAHAQGTRHIELRKIGERRFPYFDQATLAQLRNLRDELGLVFTTASPGTFKTAVLNSPEWAQNRDELFPATLDLAAALGIPRLLSFGGLRNAVPKDQALEGVAETLASLGDRAKPYGIDILIENETGCWADHPEDCLAILTLAERSNLAMHWDPGNWFRSGGEGYERAYSLLSPHIRNVHVYDVVKAADRYEFRPLGEGSINYQGQINDLLRDGYAGIVTVEAHCGPRPASFLQSLRHLERLVASR